jgi:hypothetical protein
MFAQRQFVFYTGGSSMRFETPQFIEVEDKIFGPFTFKQFIYMAGGAGLFYVCVKLIPSPFGWFVAIPVGLFSLALAFYKVNSRPFIEVLQHFITYTFKSKLYVWRKELNAVKKQASSDQTAEIKKPNEIAKVKSAHDLAKSLDILDAEKSQ